MKKQSNKKVFFLIRAYNDLDCRIPLMLSFAKDYDVCIMGVPTNGGYYHPDEYELTAFLKKEGIRFSSVFLGKRTPPLIKKIHNIHGWLRKRLLKVIEKKNHLQSVNLLLRKAIDFPLVFFVRYYEKWVPSVVAEMKDSLIIADEICFQLGRSRVIDWVINSRGKNNFSIYAFQTGQNVFIDLWHDKPQTRVRNNVNWRGTVKKFIVPGPNDLRIVSDQWTRLDIAVLGNTRFDLPWVHLSNDIALDSFKKQRIKGSKSAHRIVFMLSKIDYGILLDKLIDAINICCALSDATVIIKPHTRGMTLNAFENSIKGEFIDGSAYSSAVLIAWANTIMFTGSSVVFQAMLFKKKIVYLKYCHKYKTIFDDRHVVFEAKSTETLRKIILDNGNDSVDENEKMRFIEEHIHNGSPSGIVADNIVKKIMGWENA